MTAKRNQTSWVQDLWKKRDGSPTAADGQGLRYRAVYVDKMAKQRTKAFRTKADAKSYLDHNTAAVVAGTWVDPAKSSATFGEIAEAWLATKEGRTPKTVQGYRSLLDVVILPTWRDTPLREIDYEGVQTFISALSRPGGSSRFADRKLSASRVKQTHQLMGAVFKYAVRSKRIATNPADGVELPRLAVAEQRYLDHADVKALASAAGRFEVAVYVLAYCGLRFGELVALKVKEVDTTAKRIRVRSSVTAVAGQGMVEGSTKNHDPRTVPVPAFVAEKLAAVVGGLEGEALVFPSRKGGWLPLGEFRWAFDQAIKEAGIDPLRPHDLRHTAASLAIAAGGNIKVVQRVLGHKTATLTLDRYGHLFPDDLDKLADALDAAHSSLTEAASDAA